MTRHIIVNMADKNASIAVAQWSIVGYFEHSSSIGGEVAYLEVSVSHTNCRTVCKQPLRLSSGKVTGGAMNMNPAIKVIVAIRRYISGYPILAIAIVTKLCDQWIKPYSKVKEFLYK